MSLTRPGSSSPRSPWRRGISECIEQEMAPGDRSIDSQMRMPRAESCRRAGLAMPGAIAAIAEFRHTDRDR